MDYTPLERYNQEKWARTRGVGLVVFVVALGFSLYSHSERETIITVRDKQFERLDYQAPGGPRTRAGSKRAWLILTDDGIYEISASVAFMRLDIATPASKLLVGETYRVSIAGWSVPTIYWYPNIIEIIEGPGISPRS